MEFKAKRRKMNITIEEDKFVVRFPLLGELDQYREDMKNPELAEGLLGKFLEGLGLPIEAQKRLEPEDLNEIVMLLTDQKKA